jgi:hypothetical protein
LAERPHAGEVKLCSWRRLRQRRLRRGLRAALGLRARSP